MQTTRFYGKFALNLIVSHNHGTKGQRNYNTKIVPPQNFITHFSKFVEISLVTD